jgi:LPS export ABC transporter protein LptC
MEADTVEIIYSDSAVVRVIVKASKQFEFENGDREFPNDIFIEFYETDGTLSSTLEANSAYYTKEKDLYKAEGDVEVIGFIDSRKMNSEELYWEPQKEEIYTDKFVRIQSQDQISTGTGLVAKQDFSSYRILKPSGTIYLEEDSTNEEQEELKIEQDTTAQKNIKKPNDPKK